MKKKISIDQLEPGMYVVSTNRSWLQIPFFRKRIKSREIVEKLRSYRVTDVVIDTDRGRDISASSSSGPVDPFNHPEVLAANMSRSVVLHSRVMNETAEMMDDIRSGKGFSEKKADRQVNLLIDQVMEDPQSLLCVSVLKNADEFTFNHCVNTAILALFVGQSLGQSRSELLNFGKGALLHDLGKCMVPKDILMKPGKLNQEEETTIKTHVERGVNYLKKMNVVSTEVMQFAHEHHERMDGSGYPRGLKGDQISWCGKLAAVLDVYDAITHENYYKNSEDPKSVLEFIAKGGSSLFDPKAYKALSDCVGLYPPGTLLMLDTGEMAVSYEPNNRVPDRPRVLLLTRKDGSFCPSPEPVDLAETRSEDDAHIRSIVTAMTHEDANFNPFQIIEKYSLHQPT